MQAVRLAYALVHAGSSWRETVAIASRRSAVSAAAHDPDEAAFYQLFGAIAANPGVVTVAFDPLGGYIDLWVRLGDDDEAHEMALYDALAAYHATDGVATPIDLHVILPDEPDSAFPSSLAVMYRRL